MKKNIKLITLLTFFALVFSGCEEKKVVVKEKRTYKGDIEVAATYINESGNYSFADIAPGDYTLKLNSSLYPQYDL